MPQDAPVTVIRRVDAQLLLSEDPDISLPTQLRYDAMAPHAVTAPGDTTSSRAATDMPTSREDIGHQLIAVTTSASSVCIRVCGEVDVANRRQLQVALSAVKLTGAHTVRLDLQHLTFCDTGGCRHLLRFERDARLSGYETSIHGAKPTIRKVLALIAGADQPNLA